MSALDVVSSGDPFVVLDSATGEDITAAVVATARAHGLRSDRSTGPQVVYFIQSGESGPIKIGLTTRDNLDSRLSTLQTGNPSRLVVLGFVEGNRSAEQFLHRCFARHSIGGEWFTPAPDLVSFVTETIARGVSIARDVEAQPTQLRLVGAP